MKKQAFNYFNKKFSVNQYTKVYKKIDFRKGYPANYQRLKIFLNLLKKHKPKNIIDAGCGAGMPLIKIKKKGFNIRGYDKAKNMIERAHLNLKKNNLNQNLVFEDDFENPIKIKKNSVDCILGMGAFYYSKNFKKTMLNQKKFLKKNGRIIFSLRNKLFDVATLNNYTKKFLYEIYETKNLKNQLKSKFQNLIKNFPNTKSKIKNIDQNNVFSLTHNPLTIKMELDEIGLKCDNIYFYHFHCLPPMLENIDPVYFRKKSWKMENPLDWRGFLIASGFVVDCVKS